MIDDPILFKDHPTNEELNLERARGKNELFFALKRTSLAIYLIDLNKSVSCRYMAKFCFYNKENRYGESDTCFLNSFIDYKNIISREAMIDGIRINYPQYFQWFLFNPGWL